MDKIYENWQWTSVDKGFYHLLIENGFRTLDMYVRLLCPHGPDSCSSERSLSTACVEA